MAMIIERGTIASATGANANQTTYKRTRVRLKDYVDISENKVFLFGMPGLDIKWNARCYDAEKTYLQTTVKWEQGADVSATNLAAGTRFVRIVFAHTDTEQNILDDEIPSINASISITPRYDGTTPEATTHPIYVYPATCENFANTGLVGDLKPISAIFTEEKNGMSELKIRMPYDEYKKWKACQEGNILKAEVPVRTPPVIDNDEYATTTEVYS